MALTVRDVSTLKAYIDGVMARADHHAGEVKGIALGLAGAIIWKMDDDADISVMAREGETTNVLWAKISGKRYAFSYNHDERVIEMRAGSVRGAVVQTFTNTVTATDLFRFFDAL